MHQPAVAHWHYAQLELQEQSGMIQPFLSPPAGDHDAAHAEIQGLLDRMARELNHPDFAKLGRIWKRGAEDDTVIWGSYIWTLYDCAGDCRASAEALLQEWAELIGRNGVQVYIPPLPPGWPEQADFGM